jgi:hypothetical protein
VGINAYLRRFAGSTGAKRVAKLLSGRILRGFRKNATDDWYWFEDILTYDNGKLAQALIETGTLLQNARMVDAGVRTLTWLAETQLVNGVFQPIGNDGWYRKNGHRARFDQQPLEAQSMIEACAAACTATGHQRWADLAGQVFQWYLGHNDLGAPLWDQKTGACYDGLGPEGPNLNQGAESTLAWLLSLADMHRLQATRSSRRSPVSLRLLTTSDSGLTVDASR